MSLVLLRNVLRGNPVKVAVVGSGAAAAGVLAGLEKFASAGVQVTVFDIAGAVDPVPAGSENGTLSRATMSGIYSRARVEHGMSFPPPKTHFGQSLTKLTVEDRPLLWKSEHLGGLTNFWGGGMFPFTDREFRGWPTDAAGMDQFYRIVADSVGVCGEPDHLNQYFPRDYVNRPPLRTSPVVARLRDTINRHSGGGAHGGYRMLAGSSRLALETRAGHRHACVYCGECMLGCPQESIWSARRELARHQASGLVSSYTVGRVRHIKDRKIYFQAPIGRPADHEVAGPFDRIYVSAGCIGSTEIVMRSFGLTEGPQMLDSSILTFPVLYMGGAGGLRGGEKEYFSLCNLSIMGVPDDPAQEAVQVSIYPAFDHLWRYYTPEWLWSPLERLARLGRWRVMLGRVYLGGAADRRFDFSLENDALSVRRGPPAQVRDLYKTFLGSIRRAANHAGFYIPAVPPIGHGTSSHYGGTLPYGGNLLPVEPGGRIAPGVYLADASTFPNLPAISPTFTVMANACRTVHESLQDQ